MVELAAGATLVAEYIDRIVRDLDERQSGHVIAQLDAGLWRDTMEKLGVPDSSARATLEVLEVVRASFDPDDPSSHTAMREALRDLRQSWSG